MDRQQARIHAEQWIAAWNERNLDLLETMKSKVSPMHNASCPISLFLRIYSQIGRIEIEGKNTPTS